MVESCFGRPRMETEKKETLIAKHRTPKMPKWNTFTHPFTYNISQPIADIFIASTVWNGQNEHDIVCMQTTNAPVECVCV